MASIHGLTLKNVKTWMGREGEAFQGDIYLGDEKICFWSQDGNGGMDTFDFENMYSERSFMKVFKELYKEKPYVYTFNGEVCQMDYSIDLLMADIIDLQEVEKEFLNFNSKGYKGILVISNAYYRRTLSLSSLVTKMDDEQIKNTFKDQIDEFIKSYGEDDLKISIYRNIKEFDKELPLRKDQLYDIRKLNEFYKWETIIMEDKTITKEEFDLLDSKEQQKILELDFIPSKKNYYYYEKNYLLNLIKEEHSKEIELDER